MNVAQSEPYAGISYHVHRPALQPWRNLVNADDGFMPREPNRMSMRRLLGIPSRRQRNLFSDELREAKQKLPFADAHFMRQKVVEWTSRPSVFRIQDHQALFRHFVHMLVTPDEIHVEHKKKWKFPDDTSPSEKGYWIFSDAQKNPFGILGVDYCVLGELCLGTRDIWPQRAVGPFGFVRTVQGVKGVNQKKLSDDIGGEWYDVMMKHFLKNSSPLLEGGYSLGMRSDAFTRNTEQVGQPHFGHIRDLRAKYFASECAGLSLPSTQPSNRWSLYREDNSVHWAPEEYYPLDFKKKAVQKLMNNRA